MSKLIFTRLLRLATQGMFLYKNILYQQIDGVSMGNCLAPTVANFFLAYLEVEKLFKIKKSFHPKFYARYVDDVYCVFQSRIDFQEFFNVLNTLHPNITFTVEVGTNKLPFLDVEVELLNNQINTWVYRKSTNTNVIMNFHDIAPKSWKVGLAYCFLNRAFTVCSSSLLFQREVEILKSVFLKNSYTSSFFRKVYDDFMKQKDDTTLLSSSEVDEDSVRKVTVRLPFFGKCSTVFARTFCSLVKDRFGVEIRAAYTSVKLQAMFQLKNPTPFQFLSNVVYRFDCVNNPDLLYIGQTSRHLIERANEHLDFADKESAVAAHRSRSHCKHSNLSVQNFRVLKKCRTKFETKIFEALYIQKLHPTLNTQVQTDGCGYLLKIFR